VVFVLLCIALMTADHRLNHLDSLRAALSVVVYPVQYLVNVPVQVTQWASESLITRKALIEENSRLREQNLLLKSRSQKFATLETENMRLRELLDSSMEIGERVLVADLIAAETGLSSLQITVNKGSQEGVYKGQPLLDADGVVGQIVHVGPFSSTAVMISDVNHALPVQINRNGLRALAAGTGESNALNIEFVPANADIREGDLIVTSGMGGRFPAGYPVGTVSHVEMDYGEQFANIVALPSARLKQVREVLLVWPVGELNEPEQVSLTSNSQ
jgi:rod shape-determining protein MreC